MRSRYLAVNKMEHGGRWNLFADKVAAGFEVHHSYHRPCEKWILSWAGLISTAFNIYTPLSAPLRIHSMCIGLHYARWISAVNTDLYKCFSQHKTCLCFIDGWWQSRHAHSTCPLRFLSQVDFESSFQKTKNRWVIFDTITLYQSRSISDQIPA